MGNAYNTILKLHQDFEDLRVVLKEFLREEGLLKNNDLVKSGFILRRYSLRFDKVNLANLDKLMNELKRVIAIENDVNSKIEQIRKEIEEIEKAYAVYLKEKLHISRIFTQDMNNCFYLSRLMSNQTYSLINQIKKGVKVQGKASAPMVRTLLRSLEKMGNQILKFVDLLEQTTKKIEKFETVSFYPTERMYGRAMSKKEYRDTMAKEELIGSPKRGEGDLIGVFECNSARQVEKINSMSEDERKIFFGRIGVVGGIKLLFFRTKLKPRTGPIPQSNGLIERKFPKGTPINIAA